MVIVLDLSAHHLAESKHIGDIVYVLVSFYISLASW
jgi:hypothetical protein